MAAAVQDKDTEAGKEPAEPRDLIEAFRAHIGRFFTLFSSTAAVVAFLLFAGFMSEFGLYRLVGIPRLSFNVTSLIESGAEVLVDSLALMLSGNWRMAAALMSFAALVALWRWHDRPPVQRFAESRPTLRLARWLVLAWALALLAGLISLAQRGLAPDRDARAVATQALEEAYRDGVPNPRERLRALEAHTYRIAWFALPNLATRWLDRPQRLAAEPWVNVQQGIATRVLPESRESARHVYGWIALSTLALAVAGALLARWQSWLDDEHAHSNVVEVDGPGGRAGRSRLRVWLSTAGSAAADAPMRFLVAPLTVVLTVLSIALLPLAHGLLARPSVGSESVMLRLASDKPAKDPALGCVGKDADLRSVSDRHARALRDFSRRRPADDEYDTERQAYRRAARDFAESAMQSRCEEAIVQLWMARPPASLSAVAPEVSEIFAAETLVALRDQDVRFGTILHYPRDQEPLTLVDAVQTRGPFGRGQWKLEAFDRKAIRETVVIPDFLERSIRAAHAAHKVKPDDRDSAEQLFLSSGADAFEATLDLLESRSMHADATGVAITSIGGFSWVNTSLRPDLATRAIDLLVEIANAKPSPRWPDKDDNLRGTAITALHLTRSSYAASRIAEELSREARVSCDDAQWPLTHSYRPLRCIPQATTAAGLLLRDHLGEIDQFRGASAPRQLTEIRDQLIAFLIDRAGDAAVGPDVRGAACTGLVLAGVRRGSTSDAERGRLFNMLRASDAKADHRWLGTCINVMSLVGLDGAVHRAWLRGLVLPVDRPIPVQTRSAALISMAEMGLSSEVEFVFHAYLALDPVKDARHLRMISDWIDLVAAEPLADKFIRCAETQSDDAVVLRCQHGLSLLDDDFDGDSGEALRLAAMVDSKRSGAVRAKACEVLRKFSRQGGSDARRALRDNELDTPCRTLGAGDPLTTEGAAEASVLSALPTIKALPKDLWYEPALTDSPAKPGVLAAPKEPAVAGGAASGAAGQ